MQPQQRFQGDMGACSGVQSFPYHSQPDQTLQQEANKTAGTSTASHGYPQSQQPQSSSNSNYSHPNVMRFSSAPTGGSTASSHYPAMPQISRLNSTSDPSLNVHLGAASEPYDDPVCVPNYGGHPSLGLASSPGPIGSRPISPHQVIRSQPPPPQLQQQPPLSSVPSFPPPNLSGNTEIRSKIYYHLMNLFPEKEVLAALVKHPDETDVSKICMSIIDSTASGAQPPAQPSAQHPMAVNQQSLPVGLPSNAPLQLQQSLPQDPTMPHEDSRLRDYLNPSVPRHAPPHFQHPPPPTSGND